MVFGIEGCDWKFEFRIGIGNYGYRFGIGNIGLDLGWGFEIRN